MTLRRSVAVLAIVLAQLGSTVAAAAASQDSSLPVVFTVYAPGQAPVTDGTTIGALEQSCPTSTVTPTLQGEGGAPEPGTQPSAQEWALATVLASTSPACLPTPIPISAVNQVTVLESNGEPDLNPSAQLTGPDLTLPSDFADGSEWPVFWDAGGAVIYERPSRSATDDNATDQVTVVPGQSLQFDVYEGAAPVNVAISASTSSVAAGGTVTFTASVPGADSGETLDWNFDGAAPAASGSTVSATFANAGVYEVSVQATGPEDGFGQIEVAVGSTPAGTGTTTTPTGAVTGGATGPGGSAATPTSTDPSPGAATHRRKPRPTHRPTGASRNTAARVTVRGVGVTVKAKRGGRRGARGTPASGPAATLHVSRTTVVTGRLLGSVAAGSADGVSGSGSGRAQRISRPAGDWPWGAILGGLVAVTLLGLGAGRELRHLRLAP